MIEIVSPVNYKSQDLKSDEYKSDYALWLQKAIA